jgi:hypothetical protein
LANWNQGLDRLLAAAQRVESAADQGNASDREAALAALASAAETLDELAVQRNPDTSGGGITRRALVDVAPCGDGSWEGVVVFPSLLPEGGQPVDAITVRTVLHDVVGQIMAASGEPGRLAQMSIDVVAPIVRGQELRLTARIDVAAMPGMFICFVLRDHDQVVAVAQGRVGHF